MSLKNLGNIGFKNDLIQGSNNVASRHLSTLLPLAVSFKQPKHFSVMLASESIYEKNNK